MSIITQSPPKLDSGDVSDRLCSAWRCSECACYRFSRVAVGKQLNSYGSVPGLVSTQAIPLQHLFPPLQHLFSRDSLMDGL